MTLKRKIKILFEGIVVPYSIFILLFSITYVILKKVLSCNFNDLMIQSISNFFAILILAPLYISFIKKYNIESDEFSFKRAFYMIPLAFSICVLCNILIGFIPDQPINQVTIQAKEITDEYNVQTTLLLVAIVTPIIEELLFRGFVFDTVLKLSNSIIAIISTSLLFAIAHGNIQQGLYAFFAGIFLAYIKYKFKKIIYPIIMHLLMNLTTLVFLPTINEITNLSELFFIIFIMVSILFVTMLRINYQNKY